MNNKVASVISGIASVLLLLALAMGCIWIFCFNADFYKDEYSKLNTAGYVEVSEEELFDATDTLLDYLENRRDNLDLALANGEQFFNTQEKLHMIDVKGLYQTAAALGWVFLGVGAGLLVVVLVKKKKNALVPLLKGFFAGGAGVGAFFVVIAVAAGIDFNTFWTNFHRVFFTNDLWLMDPSVCRMIRMYELNFFFDLVLYILILFLSIYIGLMIASKIILNRKKKKVH